MEYGAVDLHTRDSVISDRTRGGAVVFERRILVAKWPAANGSRSISKAWATRSSWPIRMTRQICRRGPALPCRRRWRVTRPAGRLAALSSGIVAKLFPVGPGTGKRFPSVPSVVGL
jgi:hypothetical protein